MTATRAFLFDLGNTLVDYPLRETAEQLSFLRDFLQDCLKDPDFGSLEGVLADRRFEARLAAFNQEAEDYRVRPFADRVRQLGAEDVGLPALARMERAICDRIFEAARPFAETMGTLRKLRSMRFKIGIVSNTPWGTDPTLWRQEVQRHGLGTKLCQAAVFCGDVGYRKPDSRVFQRCLERLGVSPSRAVFVGDDLNSDVGGARSLGCSSVWLRRDRSDSRTHDGETISTLSELLDLPARGRLGP